MTSDSSANNLDSIADRLFEYFDGKKNLYISRLAEAVSIPSVSADLETHLGDIQTMLEKTKHFAESLGAKCELLPNPLHTQQKPLPPILIGDFSAAVPEQQRKKKKTVCVYGHLDVQPADKEDGWDTDPFVLTEKDGKLYGRGSTDDKGPALSWLWVMEAHRELGMELPVNLKFVYEGMEESGSLGFYEFIQEQAKPGRFFDDVDFFCISDSYWLGKTKPCLTYGLRGMSYFTLSVQGGEQDLHSGVLGGTVHEAMTDLVHLMASLVNSQGEILVDGVMDQVRPVTEEEIALYQDIEFDMESYKEEHKIKSVSNKLLHNDKQSLLMARWRFPTLSLHGIQGAFSSPGAKTVIPAKVIGKFSLRLVPDQDPKQIESVVRKHLEREFQKLKSPNRLEIEMIFGAKAWISSPDHPNYAAATAATQRVYKGLKPDFTREGGSIPITSALEEATGGMNVLLLPIGACDDMAHSQNEKYNISNLMNGVKVLAMYLHELGAVPGPKPSECRCVPLTEEELSVPGAFMKGFKCKCEL